MTAIPLERVRTDGGTQSRDCLNADTIADYAELIPKLPPVVVFYDGEVYWLADGFHRHAAHEKAGRKKIVVEVKQGSQRDAILYSAGANAQHGRPRTNADKRRAVELLLRDEVWSAKGDRWVARQCGVGHQLVGDVRGQLDESSSSAPKSTESQGRRQGKDGKWRKTPKRKPELPPAEAADEATEPEAKHWTCNGCDTVFPAGMTVCGHCEGVDERAEEFVPFIVAGEVDRCIDDVLSRWPKDVSLDQLIRTIESALDVIKQIEAQRT
jgi:hypothetical protein